MGEGEGSGYVGDVLEALPSRTFLPRHRPPNAKVNLKHQESKPPPPLLRPLKLRIEGYTASTAPAGGKEGAVRLRT